MGCTCTSFNLYIIQVLPSVGVYIEDISLSLVSYPLT